MSEHSALPVIVLRGSPRERGRQYGEQAAERVRTTRDAYEEVFAHNATWDWSRVREESRAFEEPIRRFHPDSLEEMRGIAEGAGLDFLDVLAMNLRTEILFAAKARTAGATLPPLECTSFSARDAEGDTLVGQNWDWLSFSTRTIVLLEVEPDSGPRWMTVVEAGLLAKFGMNSAGLALATNALVSAEDAGSPGVPYHVMLRALLECRTPTEAATVLQSAPRASSANYLFGSADGLAVDAETRPGGFAAVGWEVPDDDGLLLHGNHFSVATPQETGVADVGVLIMADSLFRLQRVRRLARASLGGGVEEWKGILADHAGEPFGICCHPEPGSAPVEQWTTTAAVIFEPAKLLVHLSVGNPCRGEWSTRDYSRQWA